MDLTLKISSVLSDPTRYHIYQYISRVFSDVTVQEIAQEFSIHPNVARLHLTKLEDVALLVSTTEKNGKGGRPSRLYRLSDEVIQLNFPFRDYQLLSSIAIESLISLGDVGKKALFETGKKFGIQIMEHEISRLGKDLTNFPTEEKVAIFKNAVATIGLSPVITYNEENKTYFLEVRNCPFKEVATECKSNVCGMHIEFIKGMFASLFPNDHIRNHELMLHHNATCSYIMEILD